MRQILDKELQAVKGLNNGAAAPMSEEKSICAYKLKEAIMWLGMELKRIGAPNPYPQSYNPDSTVVEPTADGLKL